MSTFLLQKCSYLLGGGGGSGKVHYEHILVTKVLMPMEGGWGGWVSGKVHYEHILATKVLMPVEGGWGGGGCPGKCTIQVMSQGMSTFLAYQREACNRYSNCLLVVDLLCGAS